MLTVPLIYRTPEMMAFGFHEHLQHMNAKKSLGIEQYTEFIDSIIDSIKSCAEENKCTTMEAADYLESTINVETASSWSLVLFHAARIKVSEERPI